MGQKIHNRQVKKAIAALLFCVTVQMSGQGKVYLTPGIGFTDLLNLGFRFQIAPQARAGFSVGWWPPGSGFLSWGNLLALNGDYYHHFGGGPERSGLRPFFLRTGVNFVADSDEVYFLTPYLKIGANIGKSELNGISLDLGAGYNIVHKNSGMIPVMPLFGVSYYIRL